MNSQKAFDSALKVFLFLSPLFFFRQYQLSQARGLFFFLGTFALFAVSLSCVAKRKFSNVWVSLFLILAFIRVFFNDANGDTNVEWINFWFCCADFIYVFTGVLLFYLVYTYADNIKQYLKPILYVCIINALLAFAQKFNHDFMWTNTPSLCGFMETSSQLGQYSALAFPLLFFLNPFYALIPLSTLILSKSVSPMLATALGALFLVGFKGQICKVKVIMAILLIIPIWLNFGYIVSKWQCRPLLWKKTVKIALQKPYLGWGYQSWKENVTDNNAKGSLGLHEFARPHNDYLHTAQELGFPILICIGMFFIGLYKKFKIANKNSLLFALMVSVIIVLINMAGQTLIRYASVAGTFIVILALFCIRLDESIMKYN
jgi:O-antigen ligase